MGWVMSWWRVRRGGTGGYVETAQWGHGIVGGTLKTQYLYTLGVAFNFLCGVCSFTKEKKKVRVGCQNSKTHAGKSFFWFILLIYLFFDNAT